MKTVDQIVTEITAEAPKQIRTQEELDRLKTWAEERSDEIGFLDIALLCAAADFIIAQGDRPQDREAAEIYASEQLFRAGALVIRSMKHRLGQPFVPARIALGAAMIGEQIAVIEMAPLDDAPKTAAAEKIISPLNFVLMQTVLAKLVEHQDLRDSGQDPPPADEANTWTMARELVS